MTNITEPLSLALGLASFRSVEGAESNVRRLSDMVDYFADNEALQRALAAGDRVVYEFVELTQEGSDGVLSFGLTRIRPGLVGREYHMTKGHFHTHGGDEVYLVSEGRGVLVLQSRQGDCRAIDMAPGSMYFVPGQWAHRTVNTGDGDLTFLAVWPGDIEHDYETILREGFCKQVLEGPDGPLITELRG